MHTIKKKSLHSNAQYVHTDMTFLDFHVSLISEQLKSILTEIYRC